jgi:hypothetical protein
MTVCFPCQQSFSQNYRAPQGFGVLGKAQQLVLRQKSEIYASFAKTTGFLQNLFDSKENSLPVCQFGLNSYYFYRGTG